MSVQYAMMGMQVAGSIASAFASKGAGQKEAMHDKLMGTSSMLERSQVGLQGAQTERNMQQEVGRLLSTNDASLGAKGIVGDVGTSAAIIRQHNMDALGENLQTTRLMTRTKMDQLSFKAADADMAAGAAEAGANQSFLTTLTGGLLKGLSMGGFGGGGKDGKPKEDPSAPGSVNP